ncbi:MaoC family dehydratase [Nocardioides yefusunii]|uniref:MaoC family dehydratase n=1 Tax=Nocardioides yefusunii TaxID=2500546 RepID=A0ABW1QYB7_9ACTN|nr:MaoC family dehydratase [Nocardioides yefusunii]
MGRTIRGIAEFRSLVGSELGTSEWFEITQERIDAFADVTEDWQWIHVDPERARAEGLGGTVAHGFLTLSLMPRLSAQVFEFAEVGRAVNYGLDKVRFPAPVHPGDRIRLTATMLEASDVDGGGVLGRVSYVVEIEGRERPAAVTQTLMVVYPEPA